MRKTFSESFAGNSGLKERSFEQARKAKDTSNRLKGEIVSPRSLRFTGQIVINFL